MKRFAPSGPEREQKQSEALSPLGPEAAPRFRGRERRPPPRAANAQRSHSLSLPSGSGDRAGAQRRRGAGGGRVCLAGLSVPAGRVLYALSRWRRFRMRDGAGTLPAFLSA